METQTITRQDMMQSVEHQASRLLRGDSDFNEKISEFAVSLRRAPDEKLRKAHKIVNRATYDELLTCLQS